MTNGQRLKKARESAGMTQRETAALLNVRIASVSDYETDRHSPDVIKAIRMCQAYGVYVEDVFKAE